MNYVGIDHHRQYSHMTVKTYRHLETRIGESKAYVSRFTDAAHLHAYAGVIPSIHSSGDRTHYGKIIKAENRWLRWRRSAPDLREMGSVTNFGNQ